MGFPRTAKRYAPASDATGIENDLIVNADVNSAAAIETSKITFGTCTAKAATDIKFVGVATKDIIVKIGEAAGAHSFIVQDSAAATQFAVTSNGDITAVGTLTMPTTVGVVFDTATGIGGKDTTYSMITAGDDFIINLKAANVADVFRIQANGTDKLLVGGTGIVTMTGGATLDNTTSAAELNITETAVKVSGTLEVTGIQTLTGVTTHTAKSVHSAALNTKRGTGADLLIARFTTAFGDPATLGNGFIGTYKDSGTAKVYIVTVDTNVFYAVEVTLVAGV